MKHSMEFELAWQGLKIGEYNYDYTVGLDFLKERGEDFKELKDLLATVNLKFTKHESFFELHFDIGGYFISPCDRCGDDFRFELWDEFDLILKLTDSESAEEVEEDADVAFISRSETVLDIGKWIYEFIILSIPLQHIHPNDEKGESLCNKEALALLGKLALKPEEKTNDIWKGLSNIKIDNKNNNKHKNK